METRKIIIIDANSVIHRAYHALPPLATRSGKIVNAVYGFLLVFLKAIKDIQPAYIAVAFDLPGPTIRHKKYKEYKAKRPKTPEDLYSQIPEIKNILKDFNVQFFEKKGFEADDVIGTISELASKEKNFFNIEKIILTGDRDSFQLADDKTKIYFLRKGVKDVVLYDKEEVKKHYSGLSPDQLVNYKALRGDPSDNIPGVRGIGEKTAVNLLLRFVSLENLYEKIKEQDSSAGVKPKVIELLKKYKKEALISRDLAQIIKNVPISFSLEKCAWGAYDKGAVIKKLEELEFKSLIGRLFDFKKVKSDDTIERTEIGKQKSLF